MNTLRVAALAAYLLILSVPRTAAGRGGPLSNDVASLLGPAAPPAPAAPASPVTEDPLERRPLGGRETAPLPAVSDDADGPLGGLPAGEIVRVGGALALVLGLIVVARTVMRRGGGLATGRPSGVLEVLGRFPLGRGHHLLLVKLGRRVLLVHQGGGSMRTLTEVVDPDEVAALLARVEAGSRGATAARFGELLQRYRKEQAAPARWPGAAAGTPLRAETATPEVVDLTRAARARRGVRA